MIDQNYDYKIIIRAPDNPLKWYWDRAVSRFRSSNGQFLSRQKALEYTIKSISETGKQAETLANYVANGALNSGSWGSMMREEVKKEYIRQYLLGRGGVNMMAPKDWGSIGGMLKEQYRYLDAFQAQIEAGELTEAQIAARSRMYFNSAREGFERANALVAKEAGFDEFCGCSTGENIAEIARRLQRKAGSQWVISRSPDRAVQPASPIAFATLNIAGRQMAQCFRRTDER